MLQKEFEALTGKKVSASEYEGIERAYMNTDLSKDDFCELWMESPKALNEIVTKTILVRRLYEERVSIVDALVELSDKYGTSELQKSISIVGAKEYIKKKLEKGYFITDADRELLIDILSK